MSEQATRCYLVSCVSQKAASAQKAKNLYLSNWFLKARRYVEVTKAPWFILSAEFGLVDPEVTIAPYERTLNTMSIGARRAWAKGVMAQMDAQLPRAGSIVILAGARYREFLLDYLRARFQRIELPMEGLKIGEQLHWLSVNTPRG
jgi:hypothetical protein